MTMPDIDYHAVFKAVSGPTMLLSPELVILDANDDFLAAVGRTLEDIVGRDIFDAFPSNPADPQNPGQQHLRASLQTVLATGERDAMDLVKYDIEVPGQPGVFEERYWAVVNVPVFGPAGRVIMVENRAEDATYVVQQVLKAQAISGLAGRARAGLPLTGRGLQRVARAAGARPATGRRLHQAG